MDQSGRDTRSITRPKPAIVANPCTVIRAVVRAVGRLTKLLRLGGPLEVCWSYRTLSRALLQTRSSSKATMHCCVQSTQMLKNETRRGSSVVSEHNQVSQAGWLGCLTKVQALTEAFQLEFCSLSM